MYNIIITHMMSGTQQISEFFNEDIAIKTFTELCMMHNMEPEEDMMDAMYTAGGIGHDYRIELHIND